MVLRCLSFALLMLNLLLGPCHWFYSIPESPLFRCMMMTHSLEIMTFNILGIQPKQFFQCWFCWRQCNLLEIPGEQTHKVQQCESFVFRLNLGVVNIQQTIRSWEFSEFSNVPDDAPRENIILLWRTLWHVKFWHYSSTYLIGTAKLGDWSRSARMNRVDTELTLYCTLFIWGLHCLPTTFVLQNFRV